MGTYSCRSTAADTVAVEAAVATVAEGEGCSVTNNGREKGSYHAVAGRYMQM